MESRPLVLELARTDDALRVAFHERHAIGESALRSYEIHPVAWEQVDRECREILGLLSRANRKSEPGFEGLTNLKRSGELLFDLLLPQSIKTRLARATGDSLTLCLDDTLIHIPWQLLYDGREFICRRFAKGRIVNTRQAPTALSERELKPPFTVLILADPRGDLPAAYREGVALRNFLDERRRLFRVDFKSYPADVALVKKILREYDIVHYAGHAIYHPDNPGESGWLLRDGTLTARAIAAMGGSRPMPALVFANACQSGRVDGTESGAGSGEEVYGLANAFLLAGVRHYIGSFADLLDEAGGVFAEGFYGALAEGNDVGMALRRARLASINRFGEAQLNWASYMLYGAPRFEFASSGKRLPGKDSLRAIQGSRSGAMCGAETDGEVKVKEPRARRWIAAAVFIASGFLGYSLFHWQGARNLRATPAGPVVMTVSADTSALAQAPLGLSMQVFGQKKEADGGFTEIIVREGSRLRSGDQFQVHLGVNRGAYVYILLYDSHGQASKLFPNPKFEPGGFLSAHNDIAIPDKVLWFWLDDHPGTETIYGLASAKPLANVPALLAKMESVQEGLHKPPPAERQQPSKGRQRGVGGVAQPKVAKLQMLESNLIKKVTAVVLSSGAAVRALSFRHE